MSILDLVTEWEADPRPVFILDEIRPDDDKKPGQQFVVYTAVIVDSRQAAEIGRQGQVVRGGLRHSQQRTVAFKGKMLFGARRRPAHEAVRQFFNWALGQCRAVATLVTTNVVLRDDASRVVGGIDGQPGPGETRRAGPVRGPELVGVLNMLKKAACDVTPSAPRVDVVLDRSRQLGLDANSRDLPDGHVETFGPGLLNTAPGGGASEFICPSEFLLLSAPERGFLADLLLLPDAIGYLRNRGGTYASAFERVRQGTPYFMEYLDVAALAGLAKPLDATDR